MEKKNGWRPNQSNEKILNKIIKQNIEGIAYNSMRQL
jgi:hypothetical protein